MDLEIIKNNSSTIKYQNTDDVIKDVCSIIDSAEKFAHQSVNIALVQRNWFIGYRIAEEELISCIFHLKMSLEQKKKVKKLFLNYNKKKMLDRKIFEVPIWNLKLGEYKLKKFNHNLRLHIKNLIY